MKRIALSLVFGALALATPGIAAAQDPPSEGPKEAPKEGATKADDTVHRHLGFYIRPELGGGFLSSSTTVGGTNISISGPATTLSLFAGYAVTENFILAGGFWGSSALSPSASVGGQSASTNSDTSVAHVGLGPQVTYYLMPINLYFSGSVGVGRMAVTTGGNSASTNPGFASRLSIGKEFWVSDHWGLGVSLAGSFGTNSSSDPGSPTWTSTTGSLLFSATYN
jgi:hypothetical protein